jgi:HAMP domain-containing protein
MSVPGGTVPAMDLPDRTPHPGHWVNEPRVDQHHGWLRETIRRHGWALQAVLGDEDGPPFVYTVGLAGSGHPELILFATGRATAARLLNQLGELVRAGHRLAAGQRVRTPSGDVHLLDFPGSERWLFAADDLYRAPGAPPVPALLVVPVDELAPAPGDELPADCDPCAGWVPGS